jgi:predicted 3-demethylubiquinone-9 3-methyltransferase (glyoxalase superfamily)
MFADFMLEKQWFGAMDSARKHEFSFNEALSLLVGCDTQEEIDYFWEKLSAPAGSIQEWHGRNLVIIVIAASRRRSKLAA